MSEKVPGVNEGGVVMEVAATPDKLVPKFATAINFNKQKNGNLIMSFVSSPMSGGSVLVETIIIDEPHSRKLYEVLGKVLKDSDAKN